MCQIAITFAPSKVIPMKYIPSHFPQTVRCLHRHHEIARIHICNVNGFNPPNESKWFAISVSSNGRIVTAVSGSRGILTNGQSESSKTPTKLYTLIPSRLRAHLATASRDLTMYWLLL